MTAKRARVGFELAADGVAVVTIEQPAKRNAMTYPMMSEMFAHFARASDDPACRVVVLTGAEGTFCAGIDLDFLAAIPPGERGIREPTTDAAGWWNIVACRRPVLAAVDGDAVGMGAEWTSQCDVRIATTRARFAWNFAQRGLVPDTGSGTWLLPRLVGMSRALELLYSGRWLTAAEALDIGYVSAVVEPDELADAAHAQARQFLSGGPQAQAAIKSLVYGSGSRSIQEHQVAHRESLHACFRSAEHAEGVAAFLERRAPRFPVADPQP